MLFRWLLLEDQLRARLLLTRQQVTQAETQLQELQLQSSRIEVTSPCAQSGLTICSLDCRRQM